MEIQEITSAYSGITKHPKGSIREFWTIFYPMALTALSGTLMLFFDRLILANYNTNAMNAALTVGMTAAIFQFGGVAITGIAEVFVGQYNGAKKYRDIGKPVWQMIWLSLGMTVLFIPLALFAGHFFIPIEFESQGLPYYYWIMGAGWLLPLNSALAAFFVGRGKVKIITYTAITANIINLVLDIILVFGWHFIPKMGTEGAAIATVISQIFQVSVLTFLFLSPKSNKHFGTYNYKFNPKLFLQCVKIGTPPSLGHIIEISAWTFLVHMVSWVGSDYVTVIAVGQSIFILFAFTNDGLRGASSTIASNLIGANEHASISRLLRNAITIQLIFAAFLFIPLVLFPDLLINGFLAKANSIKHLSQLRHWIEITLFWVWVLFIFDGFTWIFAGILTAATDTKFIMFASAINSWLFAIVPTYYFINYLGGNPSLSWHIAAYFGFINCIVFFLRYRLGPWRKMAKLV